MRWQIVLALGLVLSASRLQAQNEEVEPPPAPKVNEKTLKADASYIIGMNFGRNLKRIASEIDVDEMIKGIDDGMAGKETKMTQEEMQAIVSTFQQRMYKFLADKNAQQAEDFLVANKKKEGIVETDSGLQYKVVKAGKGPSPKATDTVTTHYHGTLLDGSVFDSSVDRGEPVDFQVNRVIPGWTEALKKMKVGDKWELYIPPELAYGEGGTPDGAIGPNELLKFEVELLGIGEAAAPPPRGGAGAPREE